MTALDDVAAERRRQIEVEGFGSFRDDGYVRGELALAAAGYAAHAGAYHRVVSDVSLETYSKTASPRAWPWLQRWWKPTSPRRDLVKAAALIIAEIERLDRANEKKAASSKIG